MSFTIELGWWLAPFAVTIAFFIWAGVNTRPTANPSYADGIIGLLFYGAASIASLVAWLVWALAA